MPSSARSCKRLPASSRILSIRFFISVFFNRGAKMVCLSDFTQSFQAKNHHFGDGRVGLGENGGAAELQGSLINKKRCRNVLHIFALQLRGLR